jgi:twitching motility protein PilI
VAEVDAVGEEAKASDGPFAALRALEQRCRDAAAGLSSDELQPGVWAGVLYLSGGSKFLSSLGEIDEVLELPGEITRVPSTRSWVRGIANNRGTLLPIFDLQEFLFQVPTPSNPKNRVLVVRNDGPAFGLLVSEVIGIRHFDTARGVAHPPQVGRLIDGLVEGGYAFGDQVYPVLGLKRLGRDSRFNTAAA